MNTSHTEDNSNPPKGVEVIGDLPPGTPWWDAEGLVIFSRSNEVDRKAVIDGISICMLAILGAIIGVWIGLPIGFGLLAYFLLTLFFLLFGILAICLGRIRGRIEIYNQQISIDSLSNMMLPWEQRVLIELTQVLEIETSKGGLDLKLNGVKGKRSGMAFGDDKDHASLVAQLLNYRIAKAKGENPPPPEGL